MYYMGYKVRLNFDKIPKTYYENEDLGFSYAQIGQENNKLNDKIKEASIEELENILKNDKYIL